MKTLYTARATTTAGREGRARTDDNSLDLPMSKPGSGTPGTNPEQLFACGYSACFGSAVEAVAKKENAAASDIAVEAEVSLNQDDNQGYFLAVTLNVVMTGVDDATARQLVEKAHQVCPYSKATRGNIEVALKVNNAMLAQAA